MAPALREPEGQPATLLPRAAPVSGLERAGVSPAPKALPQDRAVSDMN